MKSLNKCRCSPVMCRPTVKCGVTAANFSKLVSLRSSSHLQRDRCSSNCTAQTNILISQFLLDVMRTPFPDLSTSLSSLPGSKKVFQPTGARQSIISAGLELFPTLMLIIYFITRKILWSNWDVIAKLQLISLTGCRKLTRSYSEAPSTTSSITT